MNGETYLKLASAAREFAEQDDIWQAIPNAPDKVREAYRMAIQIMPEVLAEAAILVLGVVRCGAINALEPPPCTACNKPKVSWEDRCSCDSNDDQNKEM